MRRAASDTREYRRRRQRRLGAYWVKPRPREGFNRERLPDPAAYYARELGKFGRISGDGWAIAHCPFHNDVHPSFTVNLRHGGWCCFRGCGKGDLVMFQQMKYGQSFVEAAQALGAWGR